MLIFSGHLCHGRMWEKIDKPTCRRIAVVVVAFADGCFNHSPISEPIVVPNSGAAASCRADSGFRFIATGKQCPAGSLLDHSV
jgi:hypothetical protein